MMTWTEINDWLNNEALEYNIQANKAESGSTWNIKGVINLVDGAECSVNEASGNTVQAALTNFKTLCALYEASGGDALTKQQLIDFRNGEV